MRHAVINNNRATHGGAAVSDFQNLCGTSDPYSMLVDRTITYMPYGDDPDVDAPPIITFPIQILSAQQAATTLHIDHIIPRIDIQGCPCGTNDIANTFVLSGNANSQSSNLVEHPYRQAILHQYTDYVPAVPPTPDVCAGYPKPVFPIAASDDIVDESTEIENVDESGDDTEASEVGGCSTTSGGGGFFALAVLFVPRRRRAKR